jgi:hypothetical protein
MIYRAMPQETRAARHFLLHQRKLRSGWTRALRIGGPEDSYHRQADGRGHVHGAGIVTQKEPAARKQGGQVADGRLPCQIDGAMLHARGNASNDVALSR